MGDSHEVQEPSSDNVVDSWEEAGDEVSAQLEERQKKFLKKKQKEEELKAMQEAAMQQHEAQQLCSDLASDKHLAIKILRRPQSCGTLPSSSKTGTEPTKPGDHKSESKMKSLEERQAAYQEARERIFGNFTPEETESEADLGPTLVPLPPSTDNSPVLQPRIQYATCQAPVPRPRAPVAALRTIRAPHFQPIPASQGIVFSMPPPINAYGGIQQQQQRLPTIGIPLGIVLPKPRQVPFYDSRVPPPIANMAATTTLFAMQNGGAGQANPVPYGRPPAQLLQQQAPFATAYNTSPNPTNY